MNPVSIIQYIECENFKAFGSLEQILFSQPSVLIGPNNSGKTTVLQALTIWNQGIRNWFQEKKHIKNVKNSGVGLNRLLITQVPVKEAKYFWNNTKTKNGKDNIEIKITVGLWFNNEVQPCTLILKYYNSEVVYMYPSEDTFAHEGLVAFAAGIDVKILYPMSGITNQEFLLQKGAIDTYIGQGKTSEVLVNLCYKIYENNEADWLTITELMYKLFEVQLQKPLFLEANGTVELKYNTKGVSGKSNGLDISLSGRGQQEMLLLIAYLFSHKKSVLLLDEPDAHLEILRQRQVFALLKHLASENGNQIIIATHSEVIANEAGNNNLTLLVGGDIIDLTHNPSGQVRAFIEQYGMEHYYKAKLKKRIIYVEDSTDIDMLSAFAKKLKHPCQAIFDDTFYYFYTQDVEDMPDFDKDLARIGVDNYRAKQIYRQHFSVMKNAISDFKGIALFDGDAKNKTDEIEIQKDFALVYWKKYELENYFVNPNTVFSFIENTCENEAVLSKYKEIWDKQVLISIFDNRQQPYLAYKKGDEAYQSFQFEDQLMSGKKASSFLEAFFAALSLETNTPLLLRKGEFYQLISYLDLDNMSSEVKEKLDLIEQYLI
jgi:ABC-type cobalamin/Fe3+-siderophores transport system ATPase subunit